MDFDIDAVLDQLERTLNQSEHEEKEINQITQTPTAPETSQKSADDLLLLDLDPFGNPENYHNDNNQDNDDRIDRFKQDLQELYASSVLVDMPATSRTTLPDVVNQQEETSSTSLPLAVEQLEYEVRQEVSQHTLENSTDDANIANDQYEDKKEPVVFLASSSSSEDEDEGQKEKEKEKENLSSEPVIESTEILTNVTLPNEPDVVQHGTPPIHPSAVLHSVDSIVNAPMGSHLDDFITANASMNDSMALDTSSEALFTACNDNYDDEKGIQIPTEEPVVGSPITSLSLSPPSSTAVTTDVPTQDFDLVKNVLSEIFDKNDAEMIDEKPTDEKESEIVNIEQQEIYPPSISLTTNNEDFRFLDEMLASIDGSDTDIHQLNAAEVDRVDSLLREIVNAHESETTSLSSSIVHEDIPSSASAAPVPSSSEQPPIVSESSISNTSQPVVEASAASAAPIDEELVRVEQEWAKLTEADKILGSVAPEWVTDEQAPICMKCSAKFSITRRRHHCRACGKIFCATCCSQKVKLIHDDSKEDRACNDCIRTINHVEYLWNYMRNNQKPRSSVLRKRQGNLFV